MMLQLMEKFQKLFGEGGDIRSYFSPGRVNLIGEHTDYNGGHVFPCALTIGTYGVARKRGDRKIRLYSENFSKMGVIETSLDDLVYQDSAGWTNYPKGIVWTFQEKGYPIDKGFDMLMYGNIPNGSGLSSSASVELLMGIILKDMFGYEDLTMINLALMGQYGENNFNGMNCGIMDQFAIAMGKKDHAIFLDTQNLQYEYAPIHMEGCKIVIAASNKKRKLTDSKYNERRAECEEALKDIQSVKAVQALGELSEEEFEEIKDVIKNPVCRKRAKHAVYENQRTVRAVKALKNNELETFGRLMNESHISLRDDYEVTGKELDTLVEAAWKQEGVIGSRMTGAGFGGCTVSIVKEDKVEDFVKNVGGIYEKTIGYAADFYVVEIGDGTRRIS